MRKHEFPFKSETTAGKVLKISGFVLLGIIAAVFFAFVFGYFVMLLWNWLMPAIFSLGTITFWQAVGIIVLARMIFGGFKHNGDHHKRCKEPRYDSHYKEDKFYRWKYFEDFWKDEGRSLFEQYVEKRKTDINEESAPASE